MNRTIERRVEQKGYRTMEGQSNRSFEQESGRTMDG